MTAITSITYERRGILLGVYIATTHGRNIGRIPLSVPDIDRHFSNLPELFPTGRYLNMEMESSFLFHFASGHGYRAAAVCAGIANRGLDTFAKDFDVAVSHATEIALRALQVMRLSFRSPSSVMV